MKRQAYAIRIKPLSVNKAWQGKRFKTRDYEAYETELLLKLPRITIPEGDLSLTITVAYSSRASDIDNFLKPFVDVLQKKYDFNDNRIYLLVVQKLICKKGAEHIAFKFDSLTRG